MMMQARIFANASQEQRGLMYSVPAGVHFGPLGDTDDDTITQQIQLLMVAESAFKVAARFSAFWIGHHLVSISVKHPDVDRTELVKQISEKVGMGRTSIYRYIIFFNLTNKRPVLLLCPTFSINFANTYHREIVEWFSDNPDKHELFSKEWDTFNVLLQPVPMQVEVDLTVDDPDVPAQLAERETYGPLDALHPDDYVSSSKKHQKTLDLQEDIALSVTERAKVHRRKQKAIEGNCSRSRQRHTPVSRANH